MGPQTHEESQAQEDKCPRSGSCPPSSVTRLRKKIYSREDLLHDKFPPRVTLPLSVNSRIHKKKGSSEQSRFLRGHFASCWGVTTLRGGLSSHQLLIAVSRGPEFDGAGHTSFSQAGRKQGKGWGWGGMGGARTQNGAMKSGAGRRGFKTLTYSLPIM